MEASSGAADGWLVSHHAPPPSTAASAAAPASSTGAPFLPLRGGGHAGTRVAAKHTLGRHIR